MITIRRCDPFRDAEAVKGIVSVYQKAFAGQPWNEFLVCPLCNKNYGFDFQGDRCTVCAQEYLDIALVEYWSINRVTKDFYREMQNDGAVCVLAEKDATPIGFSWGYELNVTQNLNEYLDAPGLHERISGRYFYIDEVALIPEWQGQGIGTQLTQDIIRTSETKEKILLRTKAKSHMHSIALRLGGSVAMSISENRVILELASIN